MIQLKVFKIASKFEIKLPFSERSIYGNIPISEGQNCTVGDPRSCAFWHGPRNSIKFTPVLKSTSVSEHLCILTPAVTLMASSTSQKPRRGFKFSEKVEYLREIDARRTYREISRQHEASTGQVSEIKRNRENINLELSTSSS